MGPDRGQPLAAFSRQFAESSSSTEEDFLRLGRALRALCAGASELTGLVSQRAGALRGALENSRVAGADGLAARSLQELRSALEQTQGLLESLRQVSQALYQLQSQVRGIQRIGVFLKSSVFSFAMESARTPQCQQAFGTFVEELRTLAERVGSLGDNVSQEVKLTLDTQAQDLESVAAGLGEMQQLTGRLESTSRTTAAEAQSLLRVSLEALKEAEEAARQIARSSDEAVYHLQFGDIIRQKCEHVSAAIAESAAQLSQAGSQQELAHGAAAADQVLAIQTSQLELMRQEVLKAHCTLGQAFQCIGGQSSRLAQALGRSQRGGEGPAQAAQADPLQALQSDARSAEQLHLKGQDLGQKAHLTAQRAVEASQRLASHLDQVKVINGDMHLQALNAIIKTAALGEQGATLEVLSIQVDALFRESNQEVAQILSTLQGIQRHALASAPLQEPGSGPATQSRPESGLSAELERISAAYEQLRQASTQAELLADKQQSSIQQGNGELEFLLGFAQRLQHQGQAIQELRQSLAPWKAKAGTLATASTESLDKRYTMESERAVHQRISQGASAAALSPPRPAPAPSQRAPKKSMPAPAPLPAPASAALPMAEPALVAAAAPAPAAQAGPAEPAMGDNIEFF